MNATLIPKSEILNLTFHPSQPLTLGVELELQLVDWRNYQLCPAASRVLPACPSRFVQSEMYQSMLEISTGICQGVEDVHRDLLQAKILVGKAAHAAGVEVLAAGTHPFSRSDEQLLYPAPRYRMLVDRNQLIARRMTMFGLHVHIGARSGDYAMQLMNGLMHHLALLLALSASSPFLEGKDTGLASSRSTIFESKPTAGTPPSFETWTQFTDHIRLLQNTGSITSLKDLWWDIRPNPTYGTVEVRICDGLPNLSDALAVVAMIQCLAAAIDREIVAGRPTPAPPAWLMRENKWRAIRFGCEAELVIDSEGRLCTVERRVDELLQELAPIARQLQCSAYLEHLSTMLHDSSSVSRQRELYRRTGSLPALTQSLVEEWQKGPIFVSQSGKAENLLPKIGSAACPRHFSSSPA